MTPEQLRKRLGLDRSEWARALHVHERTVLRWEDESAEPQGLAAEVMRSIVNAIQDGADPRHVARMVRGGIGYLVFQGLIQKPTRRPST